MSLWIANILQLKLNKFQWTLRYMWDLLKTTYQDEERCSGTPQHLDKNPFFSRTLFAASLWRGWSPEIIARSASFELNTSLAEKDFYTGWGSLTPQQVSSSLNLLFPLFFSFWFLKNHFCIFSSFFLQKFFRIIDNNTINLYTYII